MMGPIWFTVEEKVILKEGLPFPMSFPMGFRHYEIQSVKEQPINKSYRD